MQDRTQEVYLPSSSEHHCVVFKSADNGRLRGNPQGTKEGRKQDLYSWYCLQPEMAL